jgi:NAD(P)H-dependent flavin oxidoreductase YrpB (nitropropane dioxygenase family)
MEKDMKRTPVSQLLGIEYPIIQAGIPWISNPALVAAVSEAGGLGTLHPTAGMEVGGNVIENMMSNIRQVQRLTAKPFAMSFDLGEPDTETVLAGAVEAGVRVAITYGGSPALHTGYLRDQEVVVLHQVASVRHARAAEAQGVQVVIAEGYEGGGPRGREGIPTMILLPAVVDAVSLPVIASGGIVDGRGFLAAMTLGAQGVQMGTRFIATPECIAHPDYKNAILMAIDTGTLVIDKYKVPTRLLRSSSALKLRREEIAQEGEVSETWRENVGPEQVRDALLEGNMKEGIAWSGAGVGLISEVIGAREVVEGTIAEANAIINSLRS